MRTISARPRTAVRSAADGEKQGADNVRRAADNVRRAADHASFAADSTCTPDFKTF